MAIIRLSSIIGGISGSIGGITFVNARRSPVARHRPQRRRFAIGFQPEQRALVQAIRQAWRSLTDLQRDAWRAQATEFTFGNALGQASALSGFQYYIKRNIERRETPSTLLTDPLTGGVAAALSIGPLDFSASGDYDLSAVIPVGQPATTFFVYGRPTHSTVQPRYLHPGAFLRSFTALAVPSDVRPEWVDHFGALQEDEVFRVELTSFTANQYNSPRQAEFGVTAA